MRAVALVLAMELLGCSGAGPSPFPAESQPTATTPGPYTREVSDTLTLTVAGEVDALAISCNEGDTLAGGGCDVAGGAAIVGSYTVGANGWECDATSSEDGSRLKVWAECSPAPSPSAVAPPSSRR